MKCVTEHFIFPSCVWSKCAPALFDFYFYWYTMGVSFFFCAQPQFLCGSFLADVVEWLLFLMVVVVSEMG